MFGYVTPCKMELKIKDYEKFKAYYCGLCKSIKKHSGNVPRIALNYDMTFLAVLVDSFSKDIPTYSKESCIRHPFKKRLVLNDNSCLEYAAFCNTALAYYKLLDNVQDENSLKSRIYSLFLKTYIDKAPENLKQHLGFIEQKLNELYSMERDYKGINLDELSHPFAELTGYILSSVNVTEKDNLYMLGYNLGKWIYIIDAFDDHEEDMKKGKFNAINTSCNIQNLSYTEFSSSIRDRIDFILTNCGRQCFETLNKLNLEKNHDLVFNILQFGLLEKMDKVFNKKGKTINAI
jgi:hypothetical protein